MVLVLRLRKEIRFWKALFYDGNYYWTLTLMTSFFAVTDYYHIGTVDIQFPKRMLSRYIDSFLQQGILFPNLPLLTLPLFRHYKEDPNANIQILFKVFQHN
jgi:hypothetical protein